MLPSDVMLVVARNVVGGGVERENVEFTNAIDEDEDVVLVASSGVVEVVVEVDVVLGGSSDVVDGGSGMDELEVEVVVHD